MNVKAFVQLREYFEARDLRKLRTSVSSLLKAFQRTDWLDGKVFFHPLGFAYAELFVFSNGDRIRTNIWSAVRHEQRPLMEVHDHFYNISSFVVAGRMINNLYAVNAPGAPNRAIYKGTFDPIGGRTLKKTDEYLNAGMFNTEIINQGDLYYLPKGKLHSSYVPKDEFTCTFILASQRDSPTSRILGPLNGLDKYHYRNRTMDVETLRSILEVMACKER
jgi:hypothetical protein